MDDKAETNKKKCRNCGSENTEYDSTGRGAGAASPGGALPRGEPQYYKCRDCGQIFVPGTK